MKKFLVMLVCLLIFVFGTAYSNGYAQGGSEELSGKIEALEKQLNALKEQLNKQAETTKELESLRDDVKGLLPGEEFYWAKKAQELSDKGLAPVFGKQYGKPFLRRFGRNTYIGGYMDHELEFDENGNHTFDQHRLIPFIYSDVSDRVKFATEIELEHGGTNTPGGVQDD
jgi:hypothetical protein